MRQRCYLCVGMLKMSAATLRVWCGYIVAAVAVLNGVLPYLEYTDPMSINVMEPFILICSQRWNVSLLLIGYFIIFCNAPFIHAGTEMTLLRSSRRRWADGMVLYMAAHTVIYYGFILAFSMVVAAPRGYFGNMWSRSMYMLSRFPPLEYMSYGAVGLDESFMANWPVYEAAFHSFSLLALYSFFLAMLMFVGNLAMRRFIGSLAAILVHLVGYLMISDNMMFQMRYSLLANGMLYYHTEASWGAPSVVFSYALFIFLIVLVDVILSVRIRHCDLMVSASEKL